MTQVTKGWKPPAAGVPLNSPWWCMTFPRLGPRGGCGSARDLLVERSWWNSSGTNLQITRVEEFAIRPIWHYQTTYSIIQYHQRYLPFPQSTSMMRFKPGSLILAMSWFLSSYWPAPDRKFAAVERFTYPVSKSWTVWSMDTMFNTMLCLEWRWDMMGLRGIIKGLREVKLKLSVIGFVSEVISLYFLLRWTL